MCNSPTSPIIIIIEPFSNYSGSALWILHHQVFLFRTTSNIILSLSISFLTTSIYVTLGFPLFFLPLSIQTKVPLLSGAFSNHHYVCPYHLNRFSITLSLTCETPTTPLMYLFLILPLPIKPDDYLNILISSSFNTFSTLPPNPIYLLPWIPNFRTHHLNILTTF